MSEPDLISDILQRVRAKASLPEDVAMAIERDARQYWGGERCYVAKAGENPVRRDAAELAERIRADHKRGEHIPLLARRYQRTERRIRQILGMIDQAPAANDPTYRRPATARHGRGRRPPDAQQEP
jgi:Mor family transcriptional regulator